MGLTLNHIADIEIGTLAATKRELFSDLEVRQNLSPEITREFEWETALAVKNGVGEVFGEIRNHRLREGSKILVVTSISIDQRQEILEILSSGAPLDPAMIEMLMGNYRKGREAGGLPSRHGTQRAGYCLSKVGGEVSIENCTQGIYTVRNKVVIPL